jgi:hypothetical protein
MSAAKIIAVSAQVQYFEFYFLATNALCNTLIKIEKSKINIL